MKGAIFISCRPCRKCWPSARSGNPHARLSRRAPQKFVGTAPVHMFFGLQESLKMLEEETLGHGRTLGERRAGERVRAEGSVSPRPDDDSWMLSRHLAGSWSATAVTELDDGQPSGTQPPADPRRGRDLRVHGRRRRERDHRTADRLARQGARRPPRPAPRPSRSRLAPTSPATARVRR